jgi:hypothetical protein
MSLGCWRAGKLLAGRKTGLGEADRLWLEEHLQGCGSCRADARALDALARLAEPSDADALGERAVTRALQAALREGAMSPARKAARPQARIVLSFAIAAACAGAGVLAWTSLRGGAASSDDVRAASAPSVVPPGRQVQLAHAEVVLTEGGSAEWDAAATTVRLHSGRVAVHVDKAPHRRFRVATDRFVVEVTGTRFEVAADSVEVHEGSVRVLALDGSPLAESIAAGGRWQLRDTSASAAPAPLPAAEAPPASAPGAAEPPSPEPPAARPVAVAAAPLLEDARRVLARGDAPAARRLVARALDARPSRAERAEADTLLAEVTLVEGDRAGATRRYTKVAERYADLPAGENALYAAAGLAARSGRLDEARALAERYLARYPRGRFRTDATALRDRAAREVP